jgi:CRP-like cAMP-binding protein
MPTGTRGNAARPLAKLATGIEGFDAMSSGSVPRHRTSLLIGGPSAGKRVFALQCLANSLLAVLPSAEYRQLLAGLEPVTLKLGEVLHEPTAPIRYVYFPVGCVVGLMATVADHKAVEVGLVGYEGMVGIALVLGAGASSVRTVVAASGAALRMEATRFHTTFLQCPSLQRELHRYAYAILAQARQTIACNCFHLSDARLARWLLMTSDRARSPELSLTQTFLAGMLGLRRVTVTEIAGRLWRRKLISYGRGWIRILDRPGLEAASCRCYMSIERQHGSG